MRNFFELIAKDKKTGARAGIIHTDHGDIPTPCFMPVATAGSIKALDSKDVRELKAPVILNNAYHLHLRPGENTIMKLGGVHKFMGWNGPILTDSGGFQVLSLKPEAKIDEQGVTFKSHIDGSLHRFTPAISIDIQKKLGADIIMAFDECTPDKADAEYIKEAMERTHRWARESFDTFYGAKGRAPTAYHPWKQFLFGIIQGGTSKKMRVESARFIAKMEFDGIAVGGESIGYNMEMTQKILSWIRPHVPKNKPFYTMGVGYSPSDMRRAVAGGADMFDCVSPTRMARNGALFVHPKTAKKLKIQKKFFSITNARFKEDESPIDNLCDCFTCKNHTRAYLHNLFKSGELSSYRLATIHNLHHFLKYMERMREAIINGSFGKFQ